VKVKFTDQHCETLLKGVC